VIKKSPLTCVDPQGNIFLSLTPSPKEITPGKTIVSIQPTLKDRSSSSTFGILQQIQQDLNWSILCHDSFPYFVGIGKSSTATCRSCGHQFNKEDLRVRTILLRKMASGSIVPSPINMCMKLPCISLDTSSKFSNHYKPWQVKPFDGKILVPIEVNQKLPNMDGVQWVYENKYGQ